MIKKPNLLAFFVLFSAFLFVSTSSAVAAITCAPGQVMSAYENLCVDCNEYGYNYYCPGGTFEYTGDWQGMTICPSGYRNNTTVNKSSVNECKMKTTAGYYIATKKAAQVSCPPGYFCLSETIAYDSISTLPKICTGATYSTGGATTSACTACPTGFTLDTTDGKTSSSQCKMQSLAGTYGWYENNEYYACSGGYYCPSQLLSYGDEYTLQTKCGAANYCPVDSATPTPCPAGYTANTSLTKSRLAQCTIVVPAGKYIKTANDASFTDCPADSYCPGSAGISYGSVGPITACPAGYTADTTTGKTVISQCKIQTVAGTTVYYDYRYDCTEGYYCPSELVPYGSSNSQVLDCTGANYCPAGSGAMTPCPAGYDYNKGYGKIEAAQCTILTTASTYIKNANDATLTPCPDGYICIASVIKYGQTGKTLRCTGANYSNNGYCTACPTGYTADTTDGKTDASQCKIQTVAGTSVYYTNVYSCPPGYYCPSELLSYGSGNALMGVCKGATYSAGGATDSNCTACPSGYTANMVDAKEDVTYCQMQVTAGKYIKTENDLTQIDCPADSYCAARKISYGSKTTPSKCPSPYLDDTSLDKDAVAKCKYQMPAGKFVQGQYPTTISDCDGGYTCPAELLSYGSNSARTMCIGATYCPAGTAVPIACPDIYNASYYYSDGKSDITQCEVRTTAGKHINAENDTFQTDCPAGYYCPSRYVFYGDKNYQDTNINKFSCTGATYCPTGSGAMTACPGDFRSNTTANKTDASQCQVTLSVGYYIAEANNTTSSYCPPGSYCPGNVVVDYGSAGGNSLCPGATYSESAGALSCTDCPGIYVDDLTAGKTSDRECKVQTTAGKYISGNYPDYYNKQAICPAGYECPSAMIAYYSRGKSIACTGATYCPAGTETAIACPDGYNYDTSSYKTTETACTIFVPAGKYIKTANDAAPSDCPTGYTCSEYDGSINYGSVSAELEPAYFYCAPGNYLMANSTKCEICPIDKYCNGGNKLFNPISNVGLYSCPAPYLDDTSLGKSATGQCKYQMPAGKQIYNGNPTVVSDCSQGYACTAQLVSYGSSSNLTMCTDKFYSDAAGATECTPCPGIYTDAASDPEYYASSPFYSSGYCRAQVKAGYYIKSSGDLIQTICPAGYYCSRTEFINFGNSSSVSGICPGGTSSPPGSDELGDCGRKLNVGANSLYLRSVKKTTPSLNVSIGGKTYYGNMGTGTKGQLRLNSGGTTYSVYDDSM